MDARAVSSLNSRTHGSGAVTPSPNLLRSFANRQDVTRHMQADNSLSPVLYDCSKSSADIPRVRRM